MSSKMFKRHFCQSQKYLAKHLRPFFNAVFNADSEIVFIYFLSCLELEILKLKAYDYLYYYFLFQSCVAS